MEALKYVGTRHITKSIICTDSKSAIEALNGKSRVHPMLTDILEIYQGIVQAEFDCILLWVPGHRGIRGNERADYWASRAHDKPDVTIVPIGYREYFPGIQRCIKDFFSRTWQNYRPTFLKTIKLATGYWASCSRKIRREEVVLSRMRLGHTLFTHGYILDQAADAPVCDLCRCPVTIKHIILECVHYNEARQRLSDTCRLCNVDMNVQTVLGNDESLVIDELMIYIRECNLFGKL